MCANDMHQTTQTIYTSLNNFKKKQYRFKTSPKGNTTRLGDIDRRLLVLVLGPVQEAGITYTTIRHTKLANEIISK